MPIKTLRFLRFLLCGALLVCTGAPVAAAEDDPLLRIGVLAKRGAEATLERWQPTAEYLTARLGDRRFVIEPLDFEEVVPAVADRRVDFVLANSAFYVTLEAQHGASRVATLRNLVPEGAATQFGGVIFTRAGNDAIQGLESLVGRRFAAVKETSLGGYLMARRELDDAGIDVRGDTRLRFSGTHDAVVLDVLAGRADAGTVRTDTLERMAAEGKIDLADLHVIHPMEHPGLPLLCSTRLYPEWPLARLRHTPSDVAHRVATALMEMEPDDPAARRGQVAGWTIPRNYQPVHELMRQLRVGPYRDLGRVTPREVLTQYWHWLLALAVALVASAGIASYLARLNGRIRQQEGELREARDHLEVRVAEQTATLQDTVKELEESNWQLDLARRDWNEAFDAIEHPIFIHDEQLRIVQANPAYLERAGGLDIEQARGRPYWELFPRLDGPLEACAHFPEEKRREAEELELPDGQVYLSRSFSIRNSDGETHNAIHILEDVTDQRRAQARMRTLSQAVEQAGEAVAIADTAGRIEFANPALERFLGAAHGSLQGRGLVDLLSAGSRELLGEILEHAASDTGWHGELELLATGRRRLPVFLSASALHDGGTEDVSGYVLTALDLSRLKSAEAALQYRVGFESLLSAIATRFVAVAPGGVDGEIGLALRQIGEFVGVDRSYLFTYDPDAGTISNSHEWCGEGIEPQAGQLQQLPLEGFPWLAALLRAGEVVHVPDVEHLPPEAAAEYAKFQVQEIRSLLVVPLLTRERLCGFIGFDMVREPRTWADEDIRMLQVAGEIILNARERDRATRAVRESEANLAWAERIAHLGNWVWDIEQGSLSWSDETYRIFGLTPQQFGATYEAFLEYVHPDDRAAVEEGVRCALAGEAEYGVDHRVVRADGSRRWVHEMGEVERNAAGEPVRMVGTVQDITALREAELETERLNRALRTLSRGNETLVRAESEEALVADVCRVIVEVGGYLMAWVGYAEDDAARSIRPVAHAGAEAGYLETVAMSWGENERGMGPTGTAVRTGEPVIARDLHTDPAFAPWREEATRRGYASLIALPLHIDGEVLGALTIDAAEPGAFDDNEVKLLSELANDLAFGIRALRARRERERAEQALAESRQRYRNLYDSAPTGYVSVSAADGTIIQCNERFRSMLGYGEGELEGRLVLDLYAEGADGIDRARDVLERFRGGETVHDAELRMQQADGTPMWISLSVEPVLDADGRVVESRSSVIDISARKNAERERHAMAERLQRALVQTIQAIAVTIEKRDPYTAGHQQRVAELAVCIAREMGFGEARIEGLRLGALIHDIGKIYVPSEILNRPGRLSDTEFRLIQSHPAVGHEIIQDIEFPWPLAEMVVQHHERLDGSGYPEGLKGDEILPEARILAVADVVEAMASHRPYRPALAMETALDELRQQRGTRYDPEAVDACIKLVEEAGFEFGQAGQG